MRVTKAVVQPRPRLNLHLRQQAHGLPVDRGRGRRHLGRSAPLLLQQLEQGGVAEVLLEIDAGGEILGIDLRHGQARGPEIAGKTEEGGVLVPVAMLGPDGRAAVRRLQPEEPALGPMRRQGAGRDGRSAKVAGKEFGETGVHGLAGWNSRQGLAGSYERHRRRSLQACSTAGGDSDCLVIASPARPGVAIQSDELLRHPRPRSAGQTSEV